MSRSLLPRVSATTTTQANTPNRYLTNDEAAEFLRLSPRTLEKQRGIGGGPRFRKFGRRVMYALADLEAWANARSFETTSDPDYFDRSPGGSLHDQ
ncbi:helix-turn-helix transcriptional regulator [Pseudomonas jinjuensis]|uniref:Helix-turn-helix domain-containing protein n=1 Tax=Pseudomonas jinjuensis TaxID=198616 RepID=A0A1H0JLA4_9PSED|nr:helix-turn-helix domain-containing protein [Pseudomonas jinjuensis]SDO44558.1 Helix-turn-helix domain-containing protein [Pseudomonas jinjuensis]